MTQSNEALATSEGNPNQTWTQSLFDVVSGVIRSLPDHATLGELIEAIERNRHMAAVLDSFTVQHLIEVVRTRAKTPLLERSERRVVNSSEVESADSGPLVIRRRADAPDGDMRVLMWLAEHGPQKDNEIANGAELSSEQLRIVLRQLRAKGFIHVEGTATKRRTKITRHGSAFLRKLSMGPESPSRKTTATQAEIARSA